MFVELVQATATEPARLRKAWKKLLGRLPDVAPGWLGATSGATEDGRFVALLAFESEEQARITMDRLHEQAAWAPLEGVASELRFRECPNVRAFLPDDARGVEVVHIWQGVAQDVRRIVSSFEGASQTATGRGRVAGGLMCWDPEGFVTIALYGRPSGARPAAALDALTRNVSELIDRPATFDVVDPWSVVARPVPS